MIRIQIETGNAAFSFDKHVELTRILHELADKLLCAELPFVPKLKRDAHPLFDVNGSRVGKIWESR